MACFILSVHSGDNNRIVTGCHMIIWAHLKLLFVVVVLWQEYIWDEKKKKPRSVNFNIIWHNVLYFFLGDQLKIQLVYSHFFALDFNDCIFKIISIHIYKKYFYISKQNTPSFEKSRLYSNLLYLELLSSQRLLLKFLIFIILFLLLNICTQIWVYSHFSFIL